MEDQLRQPGCQSCPLNTKGRRKVWGEGPLSSRVLVVNEHPDSEDAAGRVGWSRQRINALLQLAGIPLNQVRVEHVIQCNEPLTGSKGRKAVECCGPSIHQIVQGMPNLEAIFTFGEAALQEVSGYRASAAAARAHESALKAARRKLDRAITNKERGKGNSKGAKEGSTVEEANAKVQALQAEAPEVRGWKGIADQRGSPRRIQLQHERRGNVVGVDVNGGMAREVWLFPLLHPSSTTPYKQPRLAPLLGIDFLKFTRLWRAEQSIPPTDYLVVRTAADLGSYLEAVGERVPSQLLGAIPVALDLEYSRQQRELVCVGIGPDSQGRYAIIPIVERSGWRLPAREKAAMFDKLQQAFDDQRLAWGAHFGCGFDERILAENGLRLRGQWDTLYGFHLLFSDFGSPRDEQTDDDSRSFTQSSGYDLGFVSSVLTPFPYHKGVVTGDRDALACDTDALYEYCVGDVVRTYHAWLAMEGEFNTEWHDPAQGVRLMQLEMECTRRAQEMGSRGVPVLVQNRAARLNKVEQEMAAIKAEAQQLIGPDFNLASTHQLAAALEGMGVKVKRSSKTKNPILDGNALSKLLLKHPDNRLIDLVLRYRGLAKDVVGLDALTPSGKGRVHPSWRVHGSVSRWSCSPNLQNLTEELKELIG